MTDDQFHTIADRACELDDKAPTEWYVTGYNPTFGAWRVAFEEYVARVAANLKAQFRTESTRRHDHGEA